MTHIHIEKKDRSTLNTSMQTLRERIRGYEKKPLTAADAATLSGLPLDIAEASLLALFSQHPATLSVTENGTLRFVFQSLSQKRAEPTLWQRFQKKYLPKLIRAKHFVEDKIIFFCMPLLMLMLTANMAGLVVPLTFEFTGASILRIFPGLFLFLGIGLFGIFAVLSLLFALFLFAGLVMLLGGVALLIFSLFAFFSGELGGAAAGAILGAILTAMGVPWSQTALQNIHEMSDRTSKDAFMAQLWQTFRGYLFGARTAASTPTQDALSDERRLTALIQQQQGILCLRDLVQLFGWTPEQAEAELSRILLDYGGDIQVTENGQFRYHFTAWKEQTKTTNNEDLRPLWERPPAPPIFWSAGKENAQLLSIALLLGLLGLALSELVFPEADFFFPTVMPLLGEMQPENWLAVYGIWPYLGVACILSLRAVPWYLRRLQYRRTIIQHKTLKSICEQAETGGWHRDSGFLHKFRAELDESKGTKDGMYFFTFPALTPISRVSST